MVFRSSLSAIPLVLACGSSPPSPPQLPTREPPQSSDWSEPADFRRLREEYGDRHDFHEVCESERPVREWFELANSARWADVLTRSQLWLSHCPVDIDAHFITAVALFELGRDSEAQQHVRWFRGLLDSVLSSGDGRSVQTAYVVISIPEEYAVLRALRLRLQEQALVDGAIDAMTAQGPNGSVTVYFNPAAHFRRLDRELDDPE